MHTKFLPEGLKGGNHPQDLGIDGKIILKCISGKQGRKVCTGCIWLRIGTSAGLL
jgi:hypothetical protein